MTINRRTETKPLMLTLMLAMIVSVLYIKGANANEEPLRLTVWHSYAEGSQEYLSYTKVAYQYELNNPKISIKSVSVPYAQLVQKFITAAQGGEGPDLIRLTSQEIAKIGQVSVAGLPILEDLRPHYTPQEKSIYQPKAIAAMRFNHALYALPASQSTLSVIYNKNLFDAMNISYPVDSWTLEEMLSLSKRLTNKDVYGLSLPFKVFLWWAPFQIGFDGSLFNKDGSPSFNSTESASALQWILDLELKHKVIAPGKGYDIESIKNLFQQQKVAMIVDGSWNWGEYLSQGMNIGQVVLPAIDENRRVTPLLYYLGWSISKRSANKIAAANFVKWLSSKSVQKEFALNAYTLPTIDSLKTEDGFKDNAALLGFMKQVELGYPAPTTRSMPLLIEPIETAIELSFNGKLKPKEALDKAALELQRKLNE